MGLLPTVEVENHSNGAGGVAGVMVSGTLELELLTGNFESNFHSRKGMPRHLAHQCREHAGMQCASPRGRTLRGHGFGSFGVSNIYAAKGAFKLALWQASSRCKVN
jgi:hypothetical protein